MNLYEKLNRLDDSLVESKGVVKKKKLTESLAANEYELTYYINSAAKDRRPETVDDVYDDWRTVVFRADSDLDAWKEAFERVTGNYYDDFLAEDATEDDFISYFEDSDWGDGSHILIKLSSAENTLYNTGYTQESWIGEFVEYDYDDDIDEMLTEAGSTRDSLQNQNPELDFTRKEELKTIEAELISTFPYLKNNYNLATILNFIYEAKVRENMSAGDKIRRTLQQTPTVDTPKKQITDDAASAREKLKHSFTELDI